MKKKMHFTIMGLVAVLALALALTGCAENASGNTNASTSESADVNANVQETEYLENLDGTAWVAIRDQEEGTPEWPVNYRLEFYGDDAYLIMYHYRDYAGIEKTGYAFDGESLTFDTNNLYDVEFRGSSIYLTTARAYTWDFYQTEPIGLDAIQEIMKQVGDIWSIDITPWVREADGSSYYPNSDTEENSEIDNPSNNDDTGPQAYVYTIDGREFKVHVPIEDYISMRRLDLRSLYLAMGYNSSGSVYDSTTHEIRAKGPLFEEKEGDFDSIIVRGNIRHNPPVSWVINSTNDAGMGVEVVLHDQVIAQVTFDQLVVAVYGCEHYYDGDAHDSPYDFIEDWRSSDGGYSIP